MTANKASHDQAPTIPVVIPSRNQEATVAQVIGDFRRALPDAHIYLFDNNSSDSTSNVAREAGAEVVFSPKDGKANVVRHIFEVIDADAYLLVSGDGLYPAEAAENLLREFWATDADMAVGVRLEDDKIKSFRPMRKLGHILLARLVSALFGIRVHDVLSGYRVVSRDFAKRVYLRSSGSEVEAEMTVQCLSRGFKIVELPVSYGPQGEAPIPRRSTIGEGFGIMKAMIWTLKSARPGFFFKWVGVLALLLGFLAGWPLALEFFRSGSVHQIPLAIAAAALELVALFLITLGTLLSRVNQQHMETQATLRDLLKMSSKTNS